MFFFSFEFFCFFCATWVYITLVYTVTEQCNKAFPHFTPLFSPLNYTSFHLLIPFLMSSLWVPPGPDSPFFFFCPLLVVPPWISFVSWPCRLFSWFFHWTEIWGGSGIGPGVGAGRILASKLGQQNWLNAHREEFCWVRCCHADCDFSEWCVKVFKE